MGRAPTDEAWSALRAGDAAAARRAFDAAVADDDCGEVREGLATALYLEHVYVEAAEQHELAFSAFRTAHDHMAAARPGPPPGFAAASSANGPSRADGWPGPAPSSPRRARTSPNTAGF
jgi:hypothetical protein